MRTFALITLFFMVFCTFAQRPLEPIEQTKEGEVFPMGKNTYARITISTEINIQPYFKSMDVLLTPVEIDTLGKKVFYHLHLDAKRFPKTNLEIIVDGFSPLNLIFDNLQPNQWLRYNVFDPDVTIVDCYNQLMREGSNLLQKGMYEEARKKYESIKNVCSKVENEEEINKKITLLNSILMWRNLGEANYTRSDYTGAIENFEKILEQNPEDKYIGNRLTEAQTKQREDCVANFKMAEIFFSEKDYNSAQPLYEKTIEKSCNEMAQAIGRLQEIRMKAKRPHVLTWEFSQNTPIGLSTGDYKEHKSSGYFTIRLNSDLFELARTDGDEKLKPELNVSFGWTIKVIKPVWVFFGPGYTGVGQYLSKDGKEKLELKINNAVSPEAGLLGRIIIANKVGIALRYTYQYRFALEKEAQNDVGKTRHVFGIGFCF